MRAVGEIGSNKMEGINKTTGATTDGPKLSLTVSGVWLKVVVLAVFIAPMAAQTPGPEAPAVFTLSVPKDPITGWSGSSVVLPCEVSPLFNAEPLEVRWYRPDNSYNPALFYKDYKIQETPVDPRYKGRVSLTGGLQRGNVSLKLEGVTLADMGEYVCHVISELWYEKARVSLKVIVAGSAPLVSLTEGGGGQVNVTCVSEGWSPQPTLTWRNKAGTQIRPGGVFNTTDPQGLVSVSSWLLYSPSDSDWLSCTVSLSEERRESRVTPWISIPATASPAKDWSGAFITTLVLFLLSLCALIAVVFILYKQRGSTIFSEKSKTSQIERGQGPAGAENSKKKLSVEEGVKPEEKTQEKSPVDLTETTTLLEGAENSEKKLSVEEGVKPEEKTQEKPPVGEIIDRPEATHLLKGPKTKQQNSSVEEAVNPEDSHPVKKIQGGTDLRKTSAEATNLLKEKTQEKPPVDLTGAEKRKKKLSVKEGVKPEEKTQEKPPADLPDWHQIKGFKENISMASGHKAIRLTLVGKRAQYVEADKDKETLGRHLQVLGKEGFGSGQHYWAVKLNYKTTGDSEKLSWYVGVVRDGADNRLMVPLTHQSGFWLLSYEKQTGLEANTDPPTPVPGGEGLNTVGVFLDCDRHTLSFYNVDTESYLYTFTGVGGSKQFYPVFSPGQKDPNSIRIVD